MYSKHKDVDRAFSSLSYNSCVDVIVFFITHLICILDFATVSLNDFYLTLNFKLTNCTQTALMFSIFPSFFNFCFNFLTRFRNKMFFNERLCLGLKYGRTQQ